MKPRNIVLVGFMGAGKTTAGRILADSLQMPFVDVDACVKDRAGMSIPRLFATEGEAHFRRLEAAVLREALEAAGQVVATGGGAVGDASSLQTMLSGNFVVWLVAPLPVMMQRASLEGGRPLVSDEAARQRAAELYAARAPLYAQAHLAVWAGALPAQVAAVIEKHWRAAALGGLPVRSLAIRLPQGSYHVHVGANLLQRLPELLPGLPTRRAMVVSDSQVAGLYAAKVVTSLRAADWHVEQVHFRAGEEHKTLGTLRDLYAAFMRAGLSRDSVVIALGGGVVGDVAGFAAATFLRGVPFIQVPTTFLAQVDASVGGKVAVNLPEGKNLVGAFYQPQAVVADVATLTSLPRREVLSGLAEVIKHGFIADPELLQFVEDHLTDILAEDPEALRHCVLRSCEIKGAVVEADETETGWREVLNFGHTMGHALETVTGYARYTHGEAVAVGMVTAAKLSLDVGLKDADLARLCSLLRRAGLPVSAPEVPIHDLLAVMQRDKKVRADRMRLVLVPQIGNVQPGVEVQPGQLIAALQWQRHL